MGYGAYSALVKRPNWSLGVPRPRNTQPSLQWQARHGKVKLNPMVAESLGLRPGEYIPETQQTQIAQALPPPPPPQALPTQPAVQAPETRAQVAGLGPAPRPALPEPRAGIGGGEEVLTLPRREPQRASVSRGTYEGHTAERLGPRKPGIYTPEGHFIPSGPPMVEGTPQIGLGLDPRTSAGTWPQPAPLTPIVGRRPDPTMGVPASAPMTPGGLPVEGGIMRGRFGETELEQRPVRKPTLPELAPYPRPELGGEPSPRPAGPVPEPDRVKIPAVEDEIERRMAEMGRGENYEANYAWFEKNHRDRLKNVPKRPRQAAQPKTPWEEEGMSREELLQWKADVKALDKDPAAASAKAKAKTATDAWKVINSANVSGADKDEAAKLVNVSIKKKVPKERVGKPLKAKALDHMSKVWAVDTEGLDLDFEEQGLTDEEKFEAISAHLESAGDFLTEAAAQGWSARQAETFVRLMLARREVRP